MFPLTGTPAFTLGPEVQKVPNQGSLENTDRLGFYERNLSTLHLEAPHLPIWVRYIFFFLFVHYFGVEGNCQFMMHELVPRRSSLISLHIYKIKCFTSFSFFSVNSILRQIPEFLGDWD